MSMMTLIGIRQVLWKQVLVNSLNGEYIGIFSTVEQFTTNRYFEYLVSVNCSRVLKIPNNSYLESSRPWNSSHSHII